jgi:amino-acid N-acetyltransferase
VRDVDGVFRLISTMAERGLMLRRSKYKVVTMLANLVVAETPGGELAGCGALIPLWTDSAEIVGLAVSERLQGRQVGSGLVAALLEMARRQGFSEVITLTYQVEFFEKLGFRRRQKDRYPRKLWRECLDCPKLEECDETLLSLSL